MPTHRISSPKIAIHRGARRSTSGAGRYASSSFTTHCTGCTNIASTACASTRSEEHTSELQSLMRISYAVFCLKKKKHNTNITTTHNKSTHLCLSHYLNTQ